MALKTLKKLLGVAGAGIDESLGQDTLLDVLTEMAKTGIVMTFLDSGTIVQGQKNALIFPFPVRIVSLTILVDDTGDSVQTDVEIATSAGCHNKATVLNSEADGTVKTAVGTEGGDTGISAEIPANTQISLEVTQVPGGGSGTGLTLTALFSPIDIES